MDKPAATRTRRKREVLDDDPSWSAFWSAYPRKTSKGAARKAWTKALTKVDDPAILVAGARKVASDLDRRKRNPRPDDRGRDVTAFVPYPATWLNREQWADDDPLQPDSKGKATFGPPKARSADECSTHPGQWADNCGGCRIDRIVGDR